MGQKNTRKRTNGVKPIKTLWFDLGNVILPFDFSPAFKRLGRIGKTDPQAIRRFFHKRPWLEADCGKADSIALGRAVNGDRGNRRLTFQQDIVGHWPLPKMAGLGTGKNQRVFSAGPG